MPVTYAFENELPNKKVRNELSWLTVISWQYDGRENNGMPLPDENQRMIELEDIIFEKIIQN